MFSLKLTTKKVKYILIILFFMFFLLLNRFVPEYSKDGFTKFFNDLNKENIGMIFVGVTTIASVFCVPISWFKALGAMYFGVGQGFMYAFLSATISCIISFLVARLLGREAIIKLYDNTFKPKLSSKQQKYFEENRSLSFTYIFLLRNIYFIPFALTNYFLGITYVSFKNYIVASILGIVPGTFIYTYFFAKSLSIKESPSELVIPILLVMLYYIFIYLLKKRFEEEAYFKSYKKHLIKAYKFSKKY